MRDHWPEYLSECFGTAIMMTVGIGAIGCSGGTDSQDEVVSKAGAALINQAGKELPQ